MKFSYANVCTICLVGRRTEFLDEMCTNRRELGRLGDALLCTFPLFYETLTQIVGLASYIPGARCMRDALPCLFLSTERLLIPPGKMHIVSAA